MLTWTAPVRLFFPQVSTETPSVSVLSASITFLRSARRTCQKLNTCQMSGLQKRIILDAWTLQTIMYFVLEIMMEIEHYAVNVLQSAGTLPLSSAVIGPLF